MCTVLAAFFDSFRSVRYPAATDVEINRTFPKRSHNISESGAWKTATILSSIVSFASFSTIDPPLLFLFVFSRAKTRDFTSYSVHVREFFRCTRGVAFGERSGEFLASRRSDSEVSLFSRGFLESRPVFRASRFLLRLEENIQSRGEGEFSRIIAREVLLAGE